MHFGAHTLFHLLWILPLLLLLMIRAFRWKRQALQIFGESSDLMRRLTRSVYASRQILRGFLTLMGLAFIILAMTRPEFGTTLEMTTRTGIDVIFVIDTSFSMLAEDLKPNRLERAKLAVAEVIDALEGDRVGIVGFAGAAFVQCPLTLDYGAAKMLLDVLDVGSVPVQGTAIGEAIRTARGAFTVKERKSKMIVLLTDGEDHAGNPVGAAREAVDDGIRIDVVGVGTPEGELIPVRNADGSIDYKKDEDGGVVKTALHETTLSEIAEAGKGRYYRLTSGGGELKEIMATISKMEKGEMGSRQFTRYEERFQYVLFVAILLLSGELLISERRPLSKQWLAFFVGGAFFLCTASITSADAVTSKNAKANKLYNSKKYDEALKLYKDAQLDAPDSAPLHFNTGNAMYKLERYDEAKEEYRHTDVKDAILTAKGYYNLGNTFFRQNRFTEAIGVYKQALRLQPDDRDAKYNLELAHLKLQEQREQQQQQDKQQKEQKDKKQDKRQDSQEQDADKKRQQEQEQRHDTESRSEEAKRQPGQMSKEEALRLLEALKDREAEQQRMRREKLPERRVRGKDW